MGTLVGVLTALLSGGVGLYVGAIRHFVSGESPLVLWGLS